MLTSLRLRMTAITAGAMLIVLSVLAIGVLAVSGQIFSGEIHNRLDSTANATAHDVSEHGILALQDRTSFETGFFFLAWFPDGQIAAHRSDIDPTPFQPLAHAALDGQVHVATLNLRGSTLLVDSRLVREGSRFGNVYVLQTVTSLNDVTAVENRMLTVVGLAGGIALVVTAIAAWFVAGRAAAPIEAALRRQRQFTADASHELRTPLTIVDASLQVLQRHPTSTVAENAETVEGAEREVARMGRMVDDMLTLARADAGVLQTQPEPTDVDTLIGELVADVSSRADAEHHRVTAGHLVGGTATVDAAQLRQLVLILVDNALVHTPDGTAVEISAGRRGGELVIAVADSGPGIPPEERERVFERFRRNIAGRPGTGAGLGLAIARELAGRAGGTVRLGDNRPGLRAEVILPANGGQRPDAAGWRRWRRWPLTAD